MGEKWALNNGNDMQKTLWCYESGCRKKRKKPSNTGHRELGYGQGPGHTEPCRVMGRQRAFPVKDVEVR